MSADELALARSRFDENILYIAESGGRPVDWEGVGFRIFSQPWSRFCFGQESPLRLANDDQRLGAMTAIRVEGLRRELGWDLVELAWVRPTVRPAGAQEIGEFGWSVMLLSRRIGDADGHAPRIPDTEQ
jgi:hypothetical protein